MGLNTSLNIANAGLQSIEDAMGVTSQNISNSQTAGYVNETASTSSLSANGGPAGVMTAPTRLNVSPALQKAMYSQNGSVGSLDTMNKSLSALSSVEGATSSSDGSTTIGTLTNNLQSINTSLTTLTANPDSSAAQESVISAATTMTGNINTLSNVYQQQRQAASDNVESGVKSINTDLTNIGSLSQQIMKAKGQGLQTADLENQRYETMQSLSGKLGVTFNETASGDMVVSTSDGTRLPTRPDQVNKSDDGFVAPKDDWPLTTKSGNVSSSMYLTSDGSKGIAPVKLEGQDITSHLTGGSLGGNLQLRDQTYPRMQAQLDSFSYTMMNRFSEAGVSLFSNGSSKETSSNLTRTTPDGIVGLSSKITVSQAYQDTPSLLTRNSDGSTSGTIPQTLIQKAFATDTASNSGTNTAPSTGLGPDGKQATGYQGNQGLVQLATSLTANQSGIVAQTQNSLQTQTNIQTSLSSKVSSVSGVDVNSQLANVTTLQNSYAATAKIFSTVQSMFQSLIQAV